MQKLTHIETIVHHMKLLIDQILDQHTCPTASWIATLFRSRFEPTPQLALLRFAQARRPAWHFPIHHTLPAFHHKGFQPVVDGRHGNIPARPNGFHVFPFANHDPNRQTPYAAQVPPRVSLLQFAFQPLDSLVGKGYLKHGMPPYTVVDTSS
jgi:hypothetical protein